MLRKISALLSTVLCLGLASSCVQNPDGNVDKSKDNVTTIPTTEPSSAEHTETDEIPEDKIFLNPDGEEFASLLCSYDKDSTEPNIQYWDTGKELVKFEWSADEGIKVNDRILGCFGIYIKQILVEDEYIIVIPGGTDINSSPVYICDYLGKMLFKTYYLSNSGMVNAGAVNVIDNKIVIDGTRLTHGPSIIIGIKENWREEFSEYFDYLYEDIVYDYGDNFKLPREVYLDKSNADEMEILNPSEKVSAVFEMEYLGDGKFGSLEMVEYKTLEAFLDSYLD